MAYTSHGHQITGSPAEADKPSRVARCGGPALCNQCAMESARWSVKQDQQLFMPEKSIYDVRPVNVYLKDGTLLGEITEHAIFYTETRLTLEPVEQEINRNEHVFLGDPLLQVPEELVHVPVPIFEEVPRAEAKEGDFDFSFGSKMPNVFRLIPHEDGMTTEVVPVEWPKMPVYTGSGDFVGTASRFVTTSNGLEAVLDKKDETHG